MKYVLLVSHGTIAPAMHETMNAFFIGSRPDLLDASMKEDMGPDEYTELVEHTLRYVRPEDELIVLADLPGGSPLTYASYVINLKGMLDHTVFLAGMNLPTAIDVMLRKDTMSLSELEAAILNAQENALHPFTIPALKEECAEVI